MRALRVTVRGCEPMIAGGDNAHMLEFHLRLFPSTGRAVCNCYGIFSPTSESEAPAYREWLAEEREDRIELELRVVDTDSPSPPARSRQTHLDWNKTGELELACAFCGRVQSEVAVMVAGHNGNICDECTAVAHEIMVEKGLAK